MPSHLPWACYPRLPIGAPPEAMKHWTFDWLTLGFNLQFMVNTVGRSHNGSLHTVQIAQLDACIAPKA